MYFWLIFSLPALIFTQKTISEQKKNISSPYYDFKGSCDAINKQRPDLFCLPASPITFDDLFSSKYIESKIQDINEWFLKNPFFLNGKKVEVRRKGDSFGLYTTENIDHGQILYRFNEDDLITPFSISQKWLNSTKTDELLALPPINFEEIADLELIFAVLMHLYWNKISEYRPLMRFFPEKIETPVFTLTPYELELLKGEESYEKVIALRKGYLESWSNFTRLIKKHWTEEQIEVMFRGYEPIIEDFMYAMMLLNKYSFSEREYFALQRKPHFYIPLSLFLFKTKIEEDKISFRSNVQEQNDTKFIDRFLLAVDNITKDSELFLKVGVGQLEIQVDPNDMYFLIKGYLPENNYKDCVELYLMEESLAKSWGIPSISCFNLVNKRIIVFHAVGNLMNMNDEQYEKCNKTLAKRETFVQGFEDEKLKIFDLCVHPQWTKFDIWERPLLELDDKIKMYEKKIKKIKKYITARAKYHLSTKNAEIMKELFERRLQLSHDVKKEIFKIMESPKSYKIKEDL